jgi:hypothetical protein
MRFHLPIAAGGLIVVYFLFQIYQDRQWTTLAAEHDCQVVEDREGSRWATIGLNGHPRVGGSEGREKWRCADGTIHWPKKL